MTQLEQIIEWQERLDKIHLALYPVSKVTPIPAFKNINDIKALPIWKIKKLYGEIFCAYCESDKILKRDSCSNCGAPYNH